MMSCSRWKECYTAEKLFNAVQQGAEFRLVEFLSLLHACSFVPLIAVSSQHEQKEERSGVALVSTV